MMAQKTYREMSKHSPAFLAACEAAGISPTRRQFAKFVQHRGLAWQAHLTLRATTENG